MSELSANETGGFVRIKLVPPSCSSCVDSEARMPAMRKLFE
jgi:hypothetical protein